MNVNKNFKDINEFVKIEDILRDHGFEIKGNKNIHCPFHEDRTPSFSINNKGNYAKCFGQCNKTWDPVELEYKLGNYKDKGEVLEALKERYSLHIDSDTYKKSPSQDTSNHLELLNWYCKRCNSTLLKHQFFKQKILADKGITEDEIKELLIGYVGKGFLSNELSGNEEKIKLAKEIGLLNEEGKDSFIYKLIFPIKVEGKIISVWSRQYPEYNPKYGKWIGMKTGENPLCPNKPIVFAENLNKEFCIVTESIPDSLALIRADFPSCSLLGKEVSEANKSLFSNANARVYFMLDSDDAGKSAAKKAAIDNKAYFAPFKHDKDLDEAYLSLGDEKFKDLINKALDDAYHYKNLEEEDRISKVSNLKKILHPAMDLMGEDFYYGLLVGNSPTFLCKRKAYTVQQIEDKFNLLKLPVMNKFSIEGIKNYLNGTKINPLSTYYKIKKFISEYIVFKEPWQLDVVVVWIIGTYIHRCFPLFPYLWIHSPTKRCGKTRLMELISSIAFNSSGGISTGLTEPVLFRSPSQTSSTLTWDEAENIQESEKGERLSVLNNAYRKSGQVQRCKDKDHKLETFNIYRPIALAGISNMPDTVNDRSVQIELSRILPNESVKQLRIEQLEKEAQVIRDELFMFGLEYAGSSSKAYDQFKRNEAFPESVTDDRLKDNFQVLMTIGYMLEKDSEQKSIFNSLQLATTKLVGLRIESDEEQSFVMFIKVLRNEFNAGSNEKLILNTNEIFKLCKSNGFDSIDKPSKASAFIREKFGLISENHRYINGKQKRGYEFNKNEINKLYQAYYRDNPPEERNMRNNSMITGT